MVVKRNPVIGAARGRPCLLDAIDRVVLLRARDRGVTPELAGAFFGCTAKTVQNVLGAATEGDADVARERVS